jgi:hypothetical protein
LKPPLHFPQFYNSLPALLQKIIWGFEKVAYTDFGTCRTAPLPGSIKYQPPFALPCRLSALSEQTAALNVVKA